MPIPPSPPLSNDNHFQAETERCRQILEAYGWKWEGGFENVIKTVQREEAKDGNFMTFDEVAYYVCTGGVDEMKLS